MSSPAVAPILERIRSAERRAGRREGSVRLVAASKGQPASAIRAAFAAGQRTFGENYVQELVQKAAELHDLAIEWHFIGALQRNKVRKVLELAAAVQTIDRPELATAVGRIAAELGRAPLALAEVNVGGEDTKSGCAPDELPALLAAMRAAGCPARGLMTIPPPGDARAHFARLRVLARDHVGADAELSMGMSDDFEVAIEEGATLVRVGTALFGPRAQHV
jgi:PLP dependent protein